MPWKLSWEVFQGVQNKESIPGPRTRSCHFQCDLARPSDLASGLPIHHWHPAQGLAMAKSSTHQRPFACAATRSDEDQSNETRSVTQLATVVFWLSWQSRWVVAVDEQGLWILLVHWQEPGHGMHALDASPFFALGLASPLVEDARYVLWQGVCQLLGDVLLRHT